MDRLRIAVLFGGSSEEHDISVKSAQEVAKSLDPEKYEPVFVEITRRGDWMLCDRPGAAPNAAGDPTAILLPSPHVQGLFVQRQGRSGTVSVDVVLPVLHGRHGEDGCIQGLLTLSGIPFVGCDIQSSALCMDKSLTYLVAGHAGIATPRFQIVNVPEVADPDGLTYPVFVKPARSGSSFGVNKVSRAEELQGAIDDARCFDSKILIEEAVVGEEVGCAVLTRGSDLIVGEPDRVALSHGFFRIHQEEQPERGSENASFVVPADIAPASRALVQHTAKVLFRALGCRGLSRVDLFLLDDGTVVLNEVNTMPGLTSYSRFPKMMAAAGWSLSDVIDQAVTSAMSET
jgi:D-alanine---(R)-lactate ligase